VKPLRNWLILLSALSLLSCGSKAPPMTVCLIRVPKDIPLEYLTVNDITAECTHSETGETTTKKGPDLDKFVGLPYNDALDYFQYCKQKP